MRNFFNISAVVFAIFGIAFTILPMGTIALLPIVIAIVLAFLGLRFSQSKQRLFPKIILFVSAMTFLVVLGKEVFVKDEVVVDKQFEQKKVESKKEDIKDLEGL